TAVKSRVAEKELSRSVRTVEDPLGRVVALSVAEADKIERGRRGQFKARIGLDPTGQRPCERDLLADPPLDFLRAERPKHEPELERAKPPTQRNLPVAIVDHAAGKRRLILQIFRQDAQRAEKRRAVGDEDATAIEIRKHPFMRIEDVA